MKQFSISDDVPSHNLNEKSPGVSCRKADIASATGLLGYKTSKFKSTKHRKVSRSRPKGQIAAIAAGGMIFFCGLCAMAIDYGVLTNDANRMQRGCDAAVLAGAQELKKTNNEAYNWQMAQYVAATVANQNGVTIYDANSTQANKNRSLVNSDIEILDNGTKVRVRGTVNRSLFFSRVLRRNTQIIGRGAAAAVRAAGSASTDQGPGRAAPIGITWDTFNSYRYDWMGANNNTPVFREITLIRQNKEDYGKDDFALFDLRDNNAKSPAQFLDQLIGKDVEQTYINDGSTCSQEPETCENTINAAQPAASNKLKDGIETLFDRAADNFSDGNDDDGWEAVGTKAYDAQKGGINLSNPRVMSLLVTNSNDGVPNNGTWDTPVLGYAPVYVHRLEERTVGTGKNRETVYVMTVAFLPPVSAPDGTDGSSNTGDLNNSTFRRVELTD